MSSPDAELILLIERHIRRNRKALDTLEKHLELFNLHPGSLEGWAKFKTVYPIKDSYTHGMLIVDIGEVWKFDVENSKLIAKGPVGNVVVWTGKEWVLDTTSRGD